MPVAREGTLMLRLHRFGLLILAVVLLGAGYGTRAEARTTATATPAEVRTTATATPAEGLPTPSPLPPGHALIELMRKSLIAGRTVRIMETSTTRWAGHEVLGWSVTDVDVHANAMREIDTIQRFRPNAPAISVSVWRRELVVSGGEGANRKPGGLWNCENLHGVRVRDGLSPFQIPTANATTTGPERVAGVPAWRVEINHAPWFGGTASVTLDVGQGNGDPIRLHITSLMRSGTTTIHETIVDGFSRNGVPVTVTLPKQCR